MTIKQEARTRWDAGNFIQTGIPIPRSDYDLPWVSYETYMKAQLVKAEPGEVGLLIVSFPPEATEDNELHIHPISDRIITVISGSGEFHAIRAGERKVFSIFPGCKVWMPRGIIHTFKSGANGLYVESLHNPFVRFNDPQCLVYSTYHSNR